ADREIDAVEADLDRRDAAPDTVEKTAARHLVEHADFVNEAQRMIERQKVHHRPETELLRALRDGRQKDARRRRVTQRRIMMLGQVIAVEAGPVIGLDQLQPVLEMPLQRRATVVEVIENPETHHRSPCITPLSRTAGEGLALLRR